MNNIRIDVSLEKLNVSYSSNVDIALLEYKSNDITAFISLFNGEKTDRIKIDLEKFSSLLSFLTQTNFSVGTDRKSLYVNIEKLDTLDLFCQKG